jgi:hypothetical protein
VTSVIEGALKELKKLKKLKLCEIGSVNEKLTLVCDEVRTTSVGSLGGLLPNGQTYTS